MEALNRLTTGLPTIGRFAAHLLEMCMAMCLGAVILNGLIWGSASLLGYSDLTQRFPEFSASWSL